MEGSEQSSARSTSKPKEEAATCEQGHGQTVDPIPQKPSSEVSVRVAAEPRQHLRDNRARLEEEMDAAGVDFMMAGAGPLLNESIIFLDTPCILVFSDADSSEVRGFCERRRSESGHPVLLYPSVFLPNFSTSTHAEEPPTLLPSSARHLDLVEDAEVRGVFKTGAIVADPSTEHHSTVHNSSAEYYVVGEAATEILHSSFASIEVSSVPRST